MAILRDRLGALPRPSLLSVEAALALCPILIALFLSASLGSLLPTLGQSDSAAGAIVALGLLAVAAALALAGLLLVHAAVDVVSFARDWPPDPTITPRRVGHGAARALETVAAVAFLVIVVVGADALSGDIPSPAGVGVMLLFAAGYLAVSGVVVVHGIGRAVLDALGE